MPTFQTDFTPPAAPTGIAAYANVTASSVDLSWTATSLGGDFLHYHVYRSTDGGLTFSLLATISSEALAAHSDYLAPLDVPLIYHVTVTNVDELESDPAVVSSELDIDQWWIVRPGDVSLTFHVRHVDAERDVTPRPTEQYVAMGRSRKVVVSGQQLGHEGSLSAVVTPSDRGLIDLLRAAAALPDEYVLLKTPFGEVFRVRLADVSRSRGQAGHQTVELPFIEVA